MPTILFGQVLARILEHEPRAELGRMVRRHLVETGGLGEYQEVPLTPNNPLQFVYIRAGVDTGQFVGIAIDDGLITISFGPKHDNR